VTAELFALLLLAADVDAIAAKARAATADWLAQLPDFLCDQTNRRMVSVDKGRSWRATDTHEVEVTYTQGRERYRLLRLNGVAVPGGQAANARTLGSAGEFATALKTLFDPATEPEFRDGGNDRSLRKLTFRVLAGHSRWSIGTDVRINPAYQGSISLEEDTGRVHRITMLSREFPRDFAVQSVAHSTEYRAVEIAGRPFLLPTRSLVEACNAQGRCQRSVIEFTNYRKFTAESRIVP
jgi:hypothetical protein